MADGEYLTDYTLPFTRENYDMLLMHYEKSNWIFREDK